MQQCAIDNNYFKINAFLWLLSNTVLWIQKDFMKVKKCRETYICVHFVCVLFTISRHFSLKSLFCARFAFIFPTIRANKVRHNQ